MPKYILSSDWHVRSSRPQFRIDNFTEALFRKVNFIIKCANKHNAHIIIAGDIFDNIKVGTRTINRLIRVLKKCKNKIYAVPGQHDMENHGDDLLPSPYLTLVEAGVIIDVSGVVIDNVYGIKWEGDLSFSERMINEKSVLIIHHTVTPKEPPFFLSDAIEAKEVLNMFPHFKYIVCGDYHSPHVTKQEKRTLVNCGCLARSNKDQIDYEPKIWFLNTDTGKFGSMKIPIEPGEEVFRIPKDTKADQENLSEHIQNIIELTKAEGKPEFITTVKMIMKDESFTDKQRELALKYYDEVRSV